MQLRWLLAIWTRYRSLTIPKRSRNVRCMVISHGIHPCGIYSGICHVHVLLNCLGSQVIESYFFARDDRVYRAFVGALDKYKNEIQKYVNRRLRWQLNTLRTTLDGRTITYRVSEGSEKKVLLILVPSGRLSYLTHNLMNMRGHSDFFFLLSIRSYKVPHRSELTPGCMAYHRANSKYQCPSINYCCWHARSLLSLLSHVFFM
jgi:hypothetical protein